MYASEIIKKYFTPSDDEKLNQVFYDEAGFFHLPDCISSFEKLEGGQNLKFHFEETQKFFDMPIIENGVVRGRYHLAEPHTIIVRGGYFVCKDVQDFKAYTITGKRLPKSDIKIKKAFFGNSLIVRITNNHLNVKFKCKQLIPGETYSKPIKLL